LVSYLGHWITARLLLNMLSVLSEFERELIRERVNSGITEYQRAYRAGVIGKERHSRSGMDLPPGRATSNLPTRQSGAVARWRHELARNSAEPRRSAVHDQASPEVGLRCAES